MSYDKVSLLLPMDGENNGTVFTDWGPNNLAVTRTGVVTSTAESKFYGSSALFSGTAHLRYANNSVFEFGSGDFTLEGWFRSGSATNQLILDRGNATGFSPWYVLLTSTGAIQVRSSFTGATWGVDISSATGFANSAWNHWAYTRSGDVFRLFVAGNQEATETVSGTLMASTATTTIGRNVVGATGNQFAGNMQDVRITKGAALYTANFTPPTRLIGTIDNSAVGADKILDVNGDPAERTVFAVPREAPTRIWSDVSNASGEFSIRAPAGVDHSVVAVADETGLRNDIVHRVIPV